MNFRTLCSAVVQCLFIWTAMPAIAQQLYGTIDGARIADQFSDAVVIEDLNADGVGELVVLAAVGRVFGPGPFSGAPSADLHWYDGASLLPLGPSVAGDQASGYSYASVSAGDFDADGISDILWHHTGNCGCGNLGGYAEVHSGLTQTRLARFDDPGYVAWGEVLAPLGDLDQDGFDDVGVSTHAASELRIYGGPDGHLIRVQTGIGGIDNSLASIGDLDGDGVPDYAFGSATAATVTLFSGATGAMIRRDTRGGWSGFGHAVTGVGDIDGDGMPDYAAGAPGTNFIGVLESGVHVVSGSSGSDIAYLPSAYEMFDSLGGQLDGSRDLNGDGVRDLLVASRQSWAYAHAYSLRTFSLLWRVHRQDYQQPGVGTVNFLNPAFLGDLDGDGLSEWALASPSASFNDISTGRIWIFRGAYTDADTYCTARPNSLGRAATLTFDGPITVGHAEQSLVVHDAVATSFAQLFYGTAQAGIPFGDGHLCAGGPLYRLHAPFPLDANGEGTRAIDWSGGPHVAGSGAWLAGSAFALQVVYRDLGLPGGAGFNTTNAIRIVFNE